jgi:hypothetical protein
MTNMVWRMYLCFSRKYTPEMTSSRDIFPSVFTKELCTVHKCKYPYHVARSFSTKITLLLKLYEVTFCFSAHQGITW